GALLHVANHALAKSVGFLLSGRIRAAYGSAEITAVGGLMVRMPQTGTAFMAAMLALIGLPPFGLFVSEVMIFGAGFAQGFRAVAGVALVLLVIAFAGLLRGVHAILYGPPVREPAVRISGSRPPLAGPPAAKCSPPRSPAQPSTSSRWPTCSRPRSSRRR